MKDVAIAAFRRDSSSSDQSCEELLRQRPAAMAYGNPRPSQGVTGLDGSPVNPPRRAAVETSANS